MSESGVLPSTPHQPDFDGCWGCRAHSALGLNPAQAGAPSFVLDGDRARAVFELALEHQGAPGVAHGGVLAAAFDEVFGFLTWRQVPGRHATARQETDFRSPMPVPGRLAVEAWIEQRSGRKTWLAGQATVEGRPTVVAQARALYVALRDPVGSASADQHQPTAPRC